MSTLEELERAATPGPWEAKVGMDSEVRRPDGSHMVIGDAIYHPAYVADAAFIAAIRNVTPELLAVVAAARGIVAKNDRRMDPDAEPVIGDSAELVIYMTAGEYRALKRAAALDAKDGAS